MTLPYFTCIHDPIGINRPKVCSCDRAQTRLHIYQLERLLALPEEISRLEHELKRTTEQLAEAKAELAGLAKVKAVKWPK